MRVLSNINVSVNITARVWGRPRESLLYPVTGALRDVIFGYKLLQGIPIEDFTDAPFLGCLSFYLSGYVFFKKSS